MNSRENSRFVIESVNSSNADSINVSKIKNRGIIRLVGRGINLQVYGEGNVAYIQASFQPPVEPQPIDNQPPALEIDKIANLPQGTQVRGKTAPLSRLDIFKNGELIRSIIANNQGEFTIDGLQNGIFRIIGSEGASAIVAAVPAGKVEIATPLPVRFDVPRDQHYVMDGIGNPGDDILITVKDCPVCSWFKAATVDSNGNFKFYQTNFPILDYEATYVIKARRTVEDFIYESIPFEFALPTYDVTHVKNPTSEMRYGNAYSYTSNGTGTPGDLIIIYDKNGYKPGGTVVTTVGEDGTFTINEYDYSPLNSRDNYDLYAGRRIGDHLYTSDGIGFYPPYAGGLIE